LKKAQDIGVGRGGGGSVIKVARNDSAKKYVTKAIHLKSKRVECFFQSNLSVLSVFSSVKVWFLAGSVFASAPLHACGSGYGAKITTHGSTGLSWA
jgi:hypothetical protein